jgi:hypothetical protein
MSQSNISVLLEAKNEYNKHLVTIFKEHIIRIIKNIYIDSESLCAQENTPENVFMVFQDNLSKIKNWSGSKLGNEYNEIKRRSGCDWLDDLIKVIFITNIKIMTMANKVKKDKEISIKIPAGTQILYLCILDSARKIWTRPYLFNKRNNMEYQRNMAEVNTIVESAINEVLRAQLPVKNILQEYLDLSGAETTTETPNVEVTQKVIKKLVAKELSNLNNQQQQSAANLEPKPTNKYKSKIAELLAKPATNKILPHDPDTDLIDIDGATPIGEPVKPIVAVAEPVDEPVKPIAPESVAEPVAPESVAEPVAPESVAEPVAPEPVAPEPVAIVTAEPVAPEPVAEPVAPVTELISNTTPVISKNNLSSSSKSSTSLNDLLSSTELAELDLELEEFSIDSLINQKKALSPIKVKKTTPGNIVFFKSAPKFQG